MWSLYLTAKTFGQRPSDLIGITDRWAALQFDNAVSLTGIVIENAAQEQHNVGSEKKPKWEPSYSLTQLLDDVFRLPAPERPTLATNAREALLALPGVKVWRGG